MAKPSTVPFWSPKTGTLSTYKLDLKAATWIASWLEKRKKMPKVRLAMIEDNYSPIDWIYGEIVNMVDTPIIKYDSSMFKDDAAAYTSSDGIAYNKNPSESTRIHERTHSLFNDKYELRPFPLIARIKKLNPKKHLDKSIIKTISDYIRDLIPDKVYDAYGGLDNYYDDPNEIYARLMELRHANNIDPTKVWTLNDIKNLRKSENLKDFKIFDRYSDEFILKLFNEVAQNNIQSNNQPLYARQGIKLIPKNK